MKIAFLIQAHKSFEQVSFLIDYFTKYGHLVVLHIDKKSDPLYRSLVEAHSDNPHCFFVENRIKVYWGDFSQVLATLSMMRLVRSLPLDVDRIHLMSGEDLPIIPMDKIEAFFLTNRKNEYVEFEDIGHHRWRVSRYNFFTKSTSKGLGIRIARRALRELQKILPYRQDLKDKVLYRGSQWFNISKEAMEYILDLIEKDPKLLRSFRFTSCADEHFFQIILLNSPFSNKCVNNNLYFMIWENNARSLKYLDMDDYEKMTSSQELFARKFHYDSPIYSKIIEDIND